MGDLADLVPQLFQLRLEGGAVCLAVPRGLTGQLLHAPQAVLYLSQGRLPRLERPAALPNLTPRPGHPAHQPLQRLGDGGRRLAAHRRRLGLACGGLFFGFARPLEAAHGQLPVSANTQLPHFAGLLPKRRPGRLREPPVQCVCAALRRKIPRRRFSA